MSTSPRVKYIGFGRYIDNNLLYSYAHDKTNQQAVKKECTGLLDKLRHLGLVCLDRQKCNTKNGSWYCWIDRNEVVYMVLCDGKYPERQAYKLLNEAEEELEKLPGYQMAGDELITKHAKKFIPSLVKKYEDLASLDSVYAAQTKADHVVNMMGNNVRNMMDNMGDLEALETKSSMMKDQANMFQKDAVVLKKDMRKRAWKVRFLVFLIIVAIVVCIVLGIVLHR